MNIPRMKEYVRFITDYVERPSLLIMDRLSSHTSGQVIQDINSLRTEDGENLLIPILIPSKTAFLISPLDMGAIAAFKNYFHREKRETLRQKKQAMQASWDKVSNDALRNIFLNCGITGEPNYDTLRERFLLEVQGDAPQKLQEKAEYFDSWKSGTIQVTGASLGRGIFLEPPQQLEEGDLDGDYWNKFGHNKK